MTPVSRLRGVTVPLVTPVTESGALDETSAERLVDHLASHGCGMLVLGTTGEVASLSGPMRRRLVEIAVRVSAGRTPVFACIAHNCLADAVDSARDHLRVGVDAVVAMLPNYFKLEPTEMAAYFTLLAARTPGPVLLYNMPQTTGMSIPVETIDRLSRMGNIVGLKDSEGTPGRAEQVASILGGRDDFALFMGVAAHSVSALKLGFVGLVPSSGNLYPAPWRELYDAALAENWARAEALQQRFDAIGAVIQRKRSLGQSLAALKAALAGHHLCGASMLPPLSALSPEEQSLVCRELSALS